jgi:hypothetical protein
MFDILAKQDEILTKDSEYAEKLLDQDEKNSMVQIKEMD